MQSYHLSEVRLFQYRNFREEVFHFQPGVNCILGPNGRGKTNLLHALYCLCLGKSPSLMPDNRSIMHDMPEFSVKGHFVTDKKKDTLLVHYHKETGKTLRLNDTETLKMTQHIGAYPVVMIDPYDTDLIREGSDLRRKFADAALGQTQPDYLQALMTYQKCLQARNALLKAYLTGVPIDTDLMEVYEQQLDTAARLITERRSVWAAALKPLLQSIYSDLCNSAEAAQWEYVHDAQLPGADRQADMQAGRTLHGPHTEDFEFLLNGYALKKYGSQGQQKTYATALKLAVAAHIKSTEQRAPIFLWDDVFDKLDDYRIEKLLQTALTYPQVFITDARPERTRSLMQKLGIAMHCIDLS